MFLLKKTLALLLLFPVMAMAGVPDLVLKDFDGNPRHVNEYIGKGQWTVVAIWAHDCHVCNAEISTIDFFHNDHKDKDARVLGVSLDGWEGREQAQEFVKRHDLGFPNLLIEPDMAELMKFGGGPFVGTPTG